VISRSAFRSSFSEGRRIFPVTVRTSSECCEVDQLSVPSRFQVPIRLVNFCRLLPTKLNRSIKANALEVEALLRGIVGKREIVMNEGRANNEDLMGLLMESNAADTKQAGGNAKPIMTMDNIIGELKLFYFAGMDTTAVLLTWTMVVLSMHPEWQDRAREEVRRVFGQNQLDLHGDGINQLKLVSSLATRA
jgi:cytochrome P450